MGNSPMITGNFFDGEEYVVIQNDTTRLTTSGGPGPNFDQATLYRKWGHHWEEEMAWDSVEWREPVHEGFEAIMGIIGRIAAGEDVRKH